MNDKSPGFVTFLLAFIFALLFTITALQWRAICYLEELAIQKTQYMQKKYAVQLLAQFTCQLVKYRFDDLMLYCNKYQSPLRISINSIDLIKDGWFELALYKKSNEAVEVQAQIKSTSKTGKKFEYLISQQTIMENGTPQKAFTITNWKCEI